MFYKFNCLLSYGAMALAMLLSSCDKDEDDYYYDGPNYPGSGNPTTGVLTVSPSRIEFGSDGGKDQFGISGVSGSGGTISASTTQSWIRVLRLTDLLFQVDVLANNTSSTRTGQIQITAQGSSATVTIIQAGTSNGSGIGGGGTGTGNTTRPTAPTGLTVTPSGSSSYPYALLSWNSVSDATSYQVYRSSSANGSYSQIKNISSCSWSDESVVYGNTYYYKIKASNSNGSSDFSNYVKCDFADRRTPGPPTYGNCTVSGTTMTLRWSVPSHSSYGVPTKAILKVWNPTSGSYTVLQTLSGSATSASFTYTGWVDPDGYVRAGIILENDNGSGSSIPKVYDTKNKRWIN